MNQPLSTPAARHLLERAQADLPALVQDVIRITEIPAPTFAEHLRSAFVRDQMVEFGLTDVHIDGVGNVIGRLPGTGGGPTIMLAAHLDTVFPMDTPLTVEVDGDILRGPGVGDNSASVAVMLHVAKLLRDSGTRLSGDLLLAGTVGEEGLGNLRGIKALMESHASEVDCVLILDGSIGSLVRQGIPSRRLKVVITGEGGHSWGGFGTPSAIHILAQCVAQITEIRVPSNPKTTFNVGTISGGTSVNTIAAQAECVIDLRSLALEELRRLEEKVRRIILETARQSGMRPDITVIGDRPMGTIPEEHPLCRAVREVHQHLGIHTRSYPSSTDGNVPLSMGIPAVTVGVILGGNGHRTDEYIHAQPLAKGLGQLLLLLVSLQTLPVRGK